MATTSNPSGKHSPIPAETPPLFQRISIALKTWAYKTLSAVFFSTVRFLRPAPFKKFVPTYVKSYTTTTTSKTSKTKPITLECRFFIPKDFQAGASTYPLYIDIHGGGYFSGKANLDDKICHYICNTFNYVVASPEYRLAPEYPFPTGINDCTDMALAILGDSSLPIDRSRVVVGGQSAGAGLTLAIAQDPRLKEKITSLVLFYPPTDFSGAHAGKFRDRPDGVVLYEGAKPEKAAKDGLRNAEPIAIWSYAAYGQDLTHPQLSAVFATRKDLPQRMYFMTAEYDKLCHEAFVLAKNLAGDEAKGKDESEPWDINGVKWERLTGETHAFIEQGWRSEVFAEKEDLPWKKNVLAVLGRVEKWLEEGWKST